MNYVEATRYVQSFTDYEQVPGAAYSAANYDLRRVYALLKLMGDPHISARTVHIAGTKGKGSTAAMIARVLQVAGYRTGLYTSPHLHTLRERFRIDGRMISEEEFASLTTAVEPFVRNVNAVAEFGLLTTFEVLTAIAFSHFHKERVEYQVLEAGLGGRLDATNVVTPEVCVLTSISLDHTQVLGDTVGKIAEEKSGIIKPGCTVISAPQPEEAARVITRTCRDKGVSLVKAGEDVTWRRVDSGPGGQSLAVRGRSGNYRLHIPLLGDFQLENAATAVAALEALAFSGTRLSSHDFEEGFASVSWPGRLQILRQRPVVVADGAHNPYSMGRLVETLKQIFSFGRCFVVFGASSDKDITGMVRELVRLPCDVIVATASHPRAATAGSLVEAFAEAGIMARSGGNVAGALSEALKLADGDDLICATGSLFVVAEAIDYFSPGK